MRSWFLFVPLVAVACSDPVRDRAIDELGGEKPGVPEGPLHRPGQPCGACHDEGGPGGLVFSLAGTLFQTPTSVAPLVGAYVFFEDSANRHYQTATNCAGNFFVIQEDFEPEWPVWVKVRYGRVGETGVETPMSSPIYREHSCGKCHQDPASDSTVGHVYFAPPGINFPPSGCP